MVLAAVLVLGAVLGVVGAVLAVAVLQAVLVLAALRGALRRGALDVLGAGPYCMGKQGVERAMAPTIHGGRMADHP